MVNSKIKNKMKFSFAYLLVVAATVVAACGNHDTLVDDTRTFDNENWNRFKPETFEIGDANPDDYYRIDFELVVDSALMRNEQLPLTVNLYSPDGTRRMFYAYVNLVENGRWKGQVTPGRERDGLRTLQQNIRPFFTFNNKGTYRMEIAQGTSQYDLDGIRSFRLVIERTQVDFSALDK